MSHSHFVHVALVSILGTGLFGLAVSVWPIRSRDISVRLWNHAKIVH